MVRFIFALDRLSGFIDLTNTGDIFVRSLPVLFQEIANAEPR